MIVSWDVTLIPEIITPIKPPEKNNKLEAIITTLLNLRPIFLINLKASQV